MNISIVGLGYVGTVSGCRPRVRYSELMSNGGMSQFARARFRQELAWENSEKRLIATYRHLLNGEVCADVNGYC